MIRSIKNLVGGEWTQLSTTAATPVYNPSTGEIIAETPGCGKSEIHDAAQAAHEAFPEWSATPAPQRAARLFAFKALLEEHFEEIAAIITLENGKTLDESRGDLRRGIEVVEFACGIAHLSKGENLPQVARQIDAMTMREPIGVCAGITPFNFPAMVPLWMFPIAIACGNTFILKPSEKTPLTAIRMAELLQDAGVPPGVFNLVHGGRDAVEALCSDPLIAAVSFVGSSGVAKSVYEMGTAHGKRVQAAGGAKNALIVMPDAERESTLQAILGSAYGCAGQRCMAGSLLMCTGRDAAIWTERISERISKFVVDNTSKNPQADMGPVIDAASRDRLMGRIAEASTTSSCIVQDGRSTVPDGKGFFIGPTLIDNVDHEQNLFRDELFGPILSVNRSETLDEAIHKLKTLPYGNGATIFTQSGAVARQFVRETPCGMLGINVGVPAPMALFSFSGWNHSFYGDLHVQGTEGILFYTRQKVVLSRWDKGYVRQLGW